MSLVAIGICTYRRPEGLARVLDSLETLVLRRPDTQVFVVVIDNSPDGAAQELCDRKAETSRFKFQYVNEKRKGLSNARNAVIAEARRNGATRLAFIDDDEMAQRSWLQDLLDTMDRAGTLAVAGPSYPVFAVPPDEWLPIEMYAYAPLEKEGFVKDASSANMLIDIGRLESLGLKFDPSFNETGGEDTYLISQLRARGEKIAWAPSAIVWDFIPSDRMRPMWLFRRWYRTGTTEARLGPQSWTLRGRTVNAVKGLVRLGYGSLRIAYGLLQVMSGEPQRLVASCYTACRGAGYLAGAIGHSFAEYSDRRYR